MARPTPSQALAVGIAVLIVVGYPMLIGDALRHFEPRSIAWAALAFTAATTAVRALFARPSLLGFAIQYGAGIALMALVVATNDRLGLLLVPALVNLYLALGTGWTLTTDQSLVERVAAFIQPHIPDFTRPYCRKVTALWALFFGANVVGIAALAFADAEPLWRLYTSRLYFLVITVLTVVEFVVRKIHFRNYSNHIVDRMFAALFPAKNTAQGRQSEAYLQKMRDLGLKTD